MSFKNIWEFTDHISNFQTLISHDWEGRRLQMWLMMESKEKKKNAELHRRAYEVVNRLLMTLTFSKLVNDFTYYLKTPWEVLTSDYSWFIWNDSYFLLYWRSGNAFTPVQHQHRTDGGFIHLLLLVPNELNKPMSFFFRYFCLNIAKC